MTRIKDIGARHTGKQWLASAHIALALLLGVLAPTGVGAFDLRGLVALGDDSGSGRLAKLEFRARDGFAPTSIQWSADGKHIATSGTQSTLVHIWDVDRRRLVKELTLPGGPSPNFHSIGWSPDGRFLAVCSMGGATSVRVYATGTWQIAKDFSTDQADYCMKPLFSSDGAELTIWAKDLVTVETTSWREVRRVSSSAYYTDLAWIKARRDWTTLLQDVVYVPNSRALMLAGGRYEREPVTGCGAKPPEYTSRIWIIEPDDTAFTRSLVVQCTSIGGAYVTLVAADSSGSDIAASVLEGIDNNVVRIIDRASGKVLSTPLRGFPAGVPRALVYSTDGRILLVGERITGKSSAVYLIDASTRKVLDVVHAKGALRDVAVPPRQPFFAAASDDGFAVWRFVSR